MEEATPTPNYFETTNYDQTNNLQLRLSPEKTLYEIETSLAGGHWTTIYDEKTGRVKTQWENKGEKLLNENGVQAVMRICRSVINTSTVQGKLTHTEINDFMRNFHKQLASILMRGKHNYEIKTINDYHSIILIVTSFTRLFLSRTEEGFGSTQLTETSKTIETIKTGEQQKLGKGFLGFGR